MHPDLAPGARAFHRLSPGPCGIGSDPVAPRAQGRQLKLEAAEPNGWQVVYLHHHMGAQAQFSGVYQGPVAHLQAQLDWPGRQVGPIPRRLDRHLGTAQGQGLLKLLHGPWRSHLLQAPRGGLGLQEPICWRGGSLPGDGAVAHRQHQQRHKQECQQALAPQDGVAAVGWLGCAGSAHAGFQADFEAIVTARLPSQSSGHFGSARALKHN